MPSWGVRTRDLWRWRLVGEAETSLPLLASHDVLHQLCLAQRWLSWALDAAANCRGKDQLLLVPAFAELEYRNRELAQLEPERVQHLLRHFQRQTQRLRLPKEPPPLRTPRTPQVPSASRRLALEVTWLAGRYLQYVAACAPQFVTLTTWLEPELDAARVRRAQALR